LQSDPATKLFYDLIWPRRADVLRVALFLCRDAVEAEDLAQETLLKAFRGVQAIETRGAEVKAWLLAILRNTWLDRLRSRAAHPQVSLDDALGEREEPAAEAQEHASHPQDPQELLNAFADREIIAALKALPDEIRWTLLLVDVEGMGQQEAAGLLGVPAGTIKSRAHRGRAMLREKLLPVARDRGLLRDGAGNRFAPREQS
jgi:RNA polymerase sigma-70 factor (ECF subfamily)